MTPYLHQTPNRIRIRSSWIQRHPQEVSRLIETLRARDGIQEIVHRLYAGSVAINFDSSRVSSSELLTQLEQAQWLNWVYGQVTPTEKLLLQKRFEERLGQRETARALGVSQMQVSRMERRLLTRLREKMTAAVQ